MMVTAVVDIETDTLDATKIHCIVASSISGKQKVWIEDECQQFSDWSRQIDQFISIINENKSII